MSTAVNPYLPLWEFVPDGEPKVFEGRIYIYGSHDSAGGTTYCEEDYVCWSAPTEDLGDWRWEGIIFRKNQIPENGDGKKLMFAPDVVQGMDGRYYLYFGTSKVDYIEVAVSDNPAGPFEYYGRVLDEEGRSPAGLAFDPGVLAEEGKVYLYYGFSPKAEIPGMNIKVQEASYMVELASDMKTVISKPVAIANGFVSAKGTSFEKHPFFEASSIRHYGEKYYFIYSSFQGHELCYAMADSPAGPFEYGGVIISNGDIGITEKQRAYDANNHGSIVEVNGQYYIFYHRHTHGTHFSRQGCAEKIRIQKDGKIPQVEMTSCGLNCGALPAARDYSFGIVCNLQGPKGACHIPSRPPYDESVPYVAMEKPEEKKEENIYLKNMQNQSCCGIKYILFSGENRISVMARGDAGVIKVYIDSLENRSVVVIKKENYTKEWKEITGSMKALEGIHAVYFRIESEQNAVIDLKKFRFSISE